MLAFVPPSQVCIIYLYDWFSIDRHPACRHLGIPHTCHYACSHTQTDMHDAGCFSESFVSTTWSTWVFAFKTLKLSDRHLREARMRRLFWFCAGESLSAFQGAAGGYRSLFQIAALKQAGNQKQKDKEQKAWVEIVRFLMSKSSLFVFAHCPCVCVCETSE